MTTEGVLITGANGKMGQAIARRCLDDNYFVLLNYHIHSDHVEELKKLYPERVATFKADVRKVDEVEEMVDAFSSRYDISVLVNNAGIIRDRTLSNMDDIHWNDVLDTNLTGAYNVTKAVLQYMIERGKGNIVNIASVVGVKGAFGQTNYAASKAGIIGFTKSLAKEVAKYNIRVNAVAPGYIDTDMTAGIPENVREKIISDIPMGRLGQPEEVADVVYALTELDYVTGEVINVNGGLL